MDAVWWAVVTTTTVGYGDISPVTLGGRVIATILMFTGIGLIGSVTASVATHFIEYLNQNKNRYNTDENRVRSDLIRYVQSQAEK
ncbi:potassium channel family protein [Paenactinomyces guangxiensis]|uniref:Two pore domain potassium channel family protein n=1 Tax=Paenactinomyces guangxiensis TaxID=1490290 RepID=A0A7W1WTG1_9BACL|nr:potassium channel family protein [Paenactinomyces guangxiensis]MBA4495672.1 two pore domain potassium channel family protein [Paenactinomyces guangxiensis]MBH8592660.1 two pore domain potassium channel family protein [Paenactinomyces guangxiensis]